MNQTAHFGRPIKLYCEAFNMQLNDVIITWYKDKVVLATNVTMVTVPNNVLFDKGEYYCTVTSLNVRITSNIIDLIPQGKYILNYFKSLFSNLFFVQLGYGRRLYSVDPRIFRFVSHLQLYVVVRMLMYMYDFFIYI